MSLSGEQIGEELSLMERDSKAFREQILEILWYMRGGVTYEQAWSLSPSTRKLIYNLIKENIERVKKSGLPIL